MTARAVILVALGLVAAITGTIWIVAPTVTLILLWLIRDHGPNDTPSQLRRRQLDDVIQRQEVRR